jgi:hypothetical protein
VDLRKAAITHVFTITSIAELLGEDEDWLWEISIEMIARRWHHLRLWPWRGLRAGLYRLRFENLREIVRIYKNDAGRRLADQPENH